MTKEQEEAIEYFKKHINYFKEQIKFIEAVDSDYYDEEYELYKNRVKQFETVLSMLKEKDKEIEKKNKIIDLIAEQLAELTIWDNEKEEPRILADKEEVIKYFEKKSDK